MTMKDHGEIYRGPAVDDPETFAALPQDLRDVLEVANGFIRYHGGLHLRGACCAPSWHALGPAWKGPQAFHRHYRAVEPKDLPFAQDCCGDQFLLRDGAVLHLFSDSGTLESFAPNLSQFLKAAEADPEDYLDLAPLERFRQDGGSLKPGQLIHVYPPFWAKESAQGVSLRAIAVEELLGLKIDIAKQIFADAMRP